MLILLRIAKYGLRFSTCFCGWCAIKWCSSPASPARFPWTSGCWRRSLGASPRRPRCGISAGRCGQDQPGYIRPVCPAEPVPPGHRLGGGDRYLFHPTVHPGSKRDQTIVQIWHALGAVKQFSYQCLDRPGGQTSALARAMDMHRNYDYVLCTWRPPGGSMPRGLGCPGGVLVKGMPGWTTSGSLPRRCGSLSGPAPGAGGEAAAALPAHLPGRGGGGCCGPSPPLCRRRTWPCW